MCLPRHWARHGDADEKCPDGGRHLEPLRNTGNEGDRAKGG